MSFANTCTIPARRPGAAAQKSASQRLWACTPAQRNRPSDLARVTPRPPAPGTTFEEFKAQLEASGHPAQLMDLRELGRFCVEGVRRGDFIIGHGLEDAAAMLHRRADAIGAGQLPPAALS